MKTDDLLYKYIPPEGLKSLSTYKIQKNSLFAILTNDIWNLISTYLPLRLSPLTITGVGALSLVLCYGVGLWVCDFDGCFFRFWYLILSICCALIHLVAPHLEEAQERRTLKFSPINEFLSTASNSMFLPFMNISISQVLELTEWEQFTLGVICFFLCYMPQWEAYYTNQLVTIFGPDFTECKWTLIGILVAGACLPEGTFRVRFWVWNKALGGTWVGVWNVYFIIAVIFCFCSGLILLLHTWRILYCVMITEKDFITPIRPLISPLLVILPLYTWATLSKTFPVHSTSLVFLLSISLSYLNSKLVLTRITKTKLHMFEDVQVIPWVLMLTWGVPHGVGWVVLEVLVFGACGLYGFMLLSVVVQIQAHLGGRKEDMGAKNENGLVNV